MSNFYTDKFQKNCSKELKGYFLLWEKNTLKQELLEIFFINTNPAGHIVVYVDIEDNVYLLRIDGFAKEEKFIKESGVKISFAPNSKMIQVCGSTKYDGMYKLGKVFGENGTQFENKKALIQYLTKEGRVL